MHGLIEALHSQMHLNREKNHLHPDAAQMLEIHPAFYSALEKRVTGRVPPMPQGLVAALSSIATESLVNGIYSINQYLQVSDEAKAGLHHLYQVTLNEIYNTKDIESSLRGFHFPQLVEWIRSIYPESLREALGSRPTIGRVRCQEYSPELQLRLFGISPASIRQPVLDIGCGKSASLVRHLRAMNIEAFGLDRVLTEERMYLEKGDWLNVNLGSRRWGTVISNMAFTNHFVYVQHYDVERQSRYVRAYGDILESLQMGGSFVYGPGVPDLERGIDGSKYHVEKRAIPYGHSVTKVRRIAP